MRFHRNPNAERQGRLRFLKYLRSCPKCGKAGCLVESMKFQKSGRQRGPYYSIFHRLQRRYDPVKYAYWRRQGLSAAEACANSRSQSHIRGTGHVCYFGKVKPVET